MRDTQAHAVEVRCSTLTVQCAYHGGSDSDTTAVESGWEASEEDSGSESGWESPGWLV